MGQYKSYKDSLLEKQLREVELELISLKSRQPYSPTLMNYGYRSNDVSINSYEYMRDSYDGVCASLIFTSTLPNIYPRISFAHTVINRNTGAVSDTAILTLRYEPVSKNSCRITYQSVAATIPFSTNWEYTEKVFVYSNTTGILTLEKTYVLPSD